MLMKNPRLISYQKNVKIRDKKYYCSNNIAYGREGRKEKMMTTDFRSFSHLRPEGCTCRSNWGILGRENDPGRGGGSGAK